MTYLFVRYSGMTRTASQVRQEFIDFFVQKHGHTFVRSSPVVPHEDPTLLFANAGMNQFKDVFLGTGDRKYNRAANTQKCIRAGGKHNDLEDVGKDTYHHTFFEMLGNWSFGDYFKKEAIQWAWELLTEVWGLDKRRLHVTVFAGDAKDGLEPDIEAEELWKTVTDIDPAHITRWDKKDNFWEMGETGPCGPCSEIHYDFTPDMSGGSLVNCDDERVIEIWNLVFIQFSRGEDSTLTSLPAKHVDTGMGFERIVRVIQNKSSNYDIDLWQPIFKAIHDLSGVRPYGSSMDDPIDVAYRVIADHIRCLTFAITDGVLPGADGRGYVLRRILRRAVRHVRQTLGVSGPFLYQLVNTVCESMGDAFPELQKNPTHVIDCILDEEKSFGKTLDRGLTLLGEAATHAEDQGSTVISAHDAFKLHDTYGFPIDLTEVMAEERGLTVDLAGYETLMDEAKDKARAGGAQGKMGTALALQGEEIAKLKYLGIEPTVDIDKFHARPITAKVRAIWNGRDFDNHTHNTSDETLEAIITNRTNYYGEMGGQIGDIGRIVDESNGAVFSVTESRVYGGYVLHIGQCEKGTLSIGASVILEVDRERRFAIMANHTGTHLLNHALREVLGDLVGQKGSLVAPDRLRFDFSHRSAVTIDEINTITSQIQNKINEDLRVYAEEVPLDDAYRIESIRAVFGERYPDPVRVVSIGKPVSELCDNPTTSEWQKDSIELCGGTHLPSTGAIDHFAITAEEAVGKGVRRFIAITGEQAKIARENASELMERSTWLSDLDDDRLPLELAELVEQVDEAVIPIEIKYNIRKQIARLQERVKKHKKQAAKAEQSGVVDQARSIADAQDSAIIVAEINGASPESLRSAMDVLCDRHPESAVLLLSGDEGAGKVAIIARVPKNLIRNGLKAGNWVREVAKVCGGGGGGRPDMAQAGGKDPSQIGAAIECAQSYTTEFVS